MQAKKHLRKPENWQDFETLCKRLWGEIWECPEIKKNGRSGQAQNGVDIYGIPKGEQQYFGIQCKGKDDYTNSRLTEDSINKEIANAGKSDPPIRKLYFATTANKDAKIESYVRKKNIEHLEKGLFEVHLFSWEDIVDLIEENKQTYDFYVNSLNFKTAYSVKIGFQNQLTPLKVEPKFYKLTKEYKQSIISAADYSDPLLGFFNQHRGFSPQNSSISTINLSFVDIPILIQNTGTEPIENYKIIFQINGEIQELEYTNIEASPLTHPQFETDIDTTIDKLSKSFTIKAYNPSSKLVSKDIINTSIYIKPLVEEYDLVLEWELLSNGFTQKGTLTIQVVPEIIPDFKTVSVDSPLEAKRAQEVVIEDFIKEYK